MKFSTATIKLCLTVILLSTCQLAQAQSFGQIILRILARENWAIGTAYSSAVYQGNVKDGFGTEIVPYHEETVKGKGLTYTAGTYFPVTRLGQFSSLALGVNSGANFYIWDNISKGVNSDIDFNWGGITAEMILPITADFMFGCDALETKSIPWAASIGGGFMPLLALTDFDANAGVKATVRPVIKAEAGVFFGICMKLRLMYAIGPVKYMDSENNFFDVGDGYSSKFDFTGRSSLTASLVLMPFSFTWKKTGWWNDSY